MKTLKVALTLVVLTSILVAPAIADSDGSDGSDVTVEVDGECSVNAVSLEGPGMQFTDRSVAGIGQVDEIEFTLSNTGNENATDLDWELSVLKNKTSDVIEVISEYEENDEIIEEVLNQTTQADLEGQNDTFQETDVEIPSSFYEDENELRPWYYQNKTFNVDNSVFDEGNHTIFLHGDYVCNPEKYFFAIQELELIQIVDEGQDGGFGEGDAPPEDDADDEDAEADIEQDADEATQEAEEIFDADALERLEDAQDREGDLDDPDIAGALAGLPDEGDQDQLISVNMRPVNESTRVARGRFNPVEMEIENLGDETVEDVSIIPQTEELPSEWSQESAQITSLGPEETLTRDVFLQPGSDVNGGNYFVPMLAEEAGERALEIEYVQVEVVEDLEFRESIIIDESPEQLRIEENTTQQIPMVIENTAEIPANNVSVELQNTEQCGSYETSLIEEIGVNETEATTISFDTGTELEECEGTILVSTDEGAVTFTDINIEVTPEDEIIPREFRVPFIATFWTAALLLYAIATRKYNLHNNMVKIPFVFLVMGQTVIVLYLATAYYGLVPVEMLPFEV